MNKNKPEGITVEDFGGYLDASGEIRCSLCNLLNECCRCSDDEITSYLVNHSAS